LKTRTTNDNTDVSSMIIRSSNDFFCFHCTGAYGEKYYPCHQCQFPRHRSKKPIHNVKD
jgi:hypothetical protein